MRKINNSLRAQYEERIGLRLLEAAKQYDERVDYLLKVVIQKKSAQGAFGP